MHLSMIVVTDIFGGFSTKDYDPINWGSKEDKKHFRKITTEIGTVIMGRKTFESIGHPLKDRLNIILTTQKKENKENIIFTKGSPEKIIKFLENQKIHSAAIIGGKKVFEDFFPFVDKLYITIEPIVLENAQKLNFPKTSFKLVATNVLNSKGTIVLEYNKLSQKDFL
ncbi:MULTISPECIES: dihydrofolate reductase [unclassified Thermosipho (in: thermotogales)]|uniref:dihydrofolate reductase n=1 Tax=unclassified Thermosipho (in: thermotogales) TaxID=2676525 RepID=UPI000985621C|nr:MULTISPECIES: dihydrofolate reductase [unclassified Thermosipho (in: thermotogales)]MBT1247765.1 dihydrofolate reductase [Thermosipho sp. 1244]OOC46989.1 dihydrofolate reductase [Thermosipho sp. 1223]